MLFSSHTSTKIILLPVCFIDLMCSLKMVLTGSKHVGVFKAFFSFSVSIVIILCIFCCLSNYSYSFKYLKFFCRWDCMKCSEKRNWTACIVLLRLWSLSICPPVDHWTWTVWCDKNTSVSDHSTTSVVGQRKIARLLVDMVLVIVVLEWEREATNRKQGGACRHRTCPDWLKKHSWRVEDPV